MRVGFVGDIVGKPGREMLREHLSRLKERYEIDIVIANGENASHGFGLSVKNCNEIL
ncbi:MAG: YmdB family metallophosphoesterase, partial [Epsilonproteobacteria bacterium]|nr:YmdB family metallophosphoesterase [Campylobacterota bacterium]